MNATKHTKDCQWHCDQYPWGCTCGAINMEPPKWLQGDKKMKEKDKTLAEEMRHQANIGGRSNEIDQVPVKNSLLFQGAKEIDRLNKWADEFSAAQMKERATGEAYQKELSAETKRLRGALDDIARCNIPPETITEHARKALST